MVKKSFALFISLALALPLCAEKVIEVPATGEDQTSAIKAALEEAARYSQEPVVIKLQPQIYNLHRNTSTAKVYHISNTTSVQENPDPTKHIGIWMNNLHNVTFDGNGATILTHGEMTSFGIDNCTNIKLKNFRLDASDPSVVEVTVSKVGNDFIDFDILPPSQFEVKDGYMVFKGEGWIFGDEKRESPHIAIAQIYDYDKGMTLRTDSPIRGYTKAEKIGDNTVRLYFDYQPKVKPGEKFQLRHSIRNEVATFINNSKNIEIRGVDYNFLGNFGIVSQFSENVSFIKVNFEPFAGSGRTNAGFADFLQFSSCKGLLKIIDCRFAGSHDDPINIHGTHLQVVETISPNKVIVEYRHPQTFGFLPFKPGDELGFVNRATLNYEGKPVKVKSVKELDEYKYELVLDKNISEIIDKKINSQYAVENLTWTPDVEIRGNYFSKTPTRGILITTRGKSVIEDNTFFRIPMAAILVADDANSWYESGPVSDLTIRNNVFVGCASPVIQVSPEIRSYNEPVHSDITITGNQFLPAKPGTIQIKASDGILINKNLFEVSNPDAIAESDLIILKDVTDCKVENNRIVNEF